MRRSWYSVKLGRSETPLLASLCHSGRELTLTKCRGAREKIRARSSMLVVTPLSFPAVPRHFVTTSERFQDIDLSIVNQGGGGPRSGPPTTCQRLLIIWAISGTSFYFQPRRSAAQHPFKMQGLLRDSFPLPHHLRHPTVSHHSSMSPQDNHQAFRAHQNNPHERGVRLNSLLTHLHHAMFLDGMRINIQADDFNLTCNIDHSANSTSVKTTDPALPQLSSASDPPQLGSIWPPPIAFWASHLQRTCQDCAAQDKEERGRNEDEKEIRRNTIRLHPPIPIHLTPRTPQPISTMRRGEDGGQVHSRIAPADHRRWSSTKQLAACEGCTRRWRRSRGGRGEEEAWGRGKRGGGEGRGVEEEGEQGRDLKDLSLQVYRERRIGS
ncbi:hypothetical protein B0H10DRAFT_1942101 [Mycena sp. CBHHK59/15]|nr:hypothetical protein B0H10DRAFT_1942101 [Mycena sp. CBHHK59/15]